MGASFKKLGSFLQKRTEDEVLRVLDARRNSMRMKRRVYKCEVCGNIVEVLEEGQGQLVCCGRAMKLLEEKMAEAEGREKHVPVVERRGKSSRPTAPTLSCSLLKWVVCLTLWRPTTIYSG